MLGQGPVFHFVYCQSCKLSTDNSSRENVIAAWNRRTPPAAVPDPVAYLVESKNDPTIRWVQFTPEVPDGVSATVSNLYRYAPPAAVPDGYLDDIAARLWKAEAEDSGTPKSVVSGRTREAFDDQDVELKNRWRKFARAAISAAPAAPNGWQPTHRHKKRGSTYRVEGYAILQAAEPCEETAVLVIYRGKDGRLWARPHDEFHDGRFDEIPAAPTEASDE